MERQMQEDGSSSEEDELAVLIVDSEDGDSDHSFPGSEIHPQPIGLHRSTPKKDSDSKVLTEAHTNQSLDDDGQTCTICFEPWTNSSEHRLVSLRCGHLFGRSCITRWLKGQSARCPQCNARARKSEIRNIYAKAVKFY
ncbi:UNVERIFIED_CONTAM: E3 ubiquitin-protein ligase RFWD3 [Trichonephila clavipes]